MILFISKLVNATSVQHTFGRSLLCDHEHCNALQCDVCHMQCPAQLPGKEEPTVCHLCQVSNHRWLLLLLDLQWETWTIIYISLLFGSHYGMTGGKLLFIAKYLFPWKSGRTCTSLVKAAIKDRFSSTIIVSNILFRSSNNEISEILHRELILLRHFSKSDLLKKKSYFG